MPTNSKLTPLLISPIFKIRVGRNQSVGHPSRSKWEIGITPPNLILLRSKTDDDVHHYLPPTKHFKVWVKATIRKRCHHHDGDDQLHNLKSNGIPAVKSAIKVRDNKCTASVFHSGVGNAKCFLKPTADPIAAIINAFRPEGLALCVGCVILSSFLNEERFQYNEF